MAKSMKYILLLLAFGIITAAKELGTDSYQNENDQSVLIQNTVLVRGHAAETAAHPEPHQEKAIHPKGATELSQVASSHNISDGGVPGWMKDAFNGVKKLLPQTTQKAVMAFTTLKEKASSFEEALATCAGTLSDAPADIPGRILEAVKNVFRCLSKAVNALLDAVEDATGQLVTLLTPGVPREHLTVITTMQLSVMNGTKALREGCTAAIGQVEQAVQDSSSKACDGVSSSLGTIQDKANEFTSSVSNLKELAVSTGSDGLQKMIQSMQALLPKELTDKLTAFLSTVSEVTDEIIVTTPKAVTSFKQAVTSQMEKSVCKEHAARFWGSTKFWVLIGALSSIFLCLVATLVCRQSTS